MTDGLLTTIITGAPNFIGLLVGLWALFRIINLQHALILKQSDDIKDLCERAVRAETMNAQAEGKP